MKTIIVHNLEQALTALNAAKPLTLQTAPGALSYAGTLYFKEMLVLIREQHPEAELILDCGADTNAFFQAVRSGFTQLRINVPGPIRTKLHAIASETGITIYEDRAATPDLLNRQDGFTVDQSQ